MDTNFLTRITRIITNGQAGLEFALIRVSPVPLFPFVSIRVIRG